MFWRIALAKAFQENTHAHGFSLEFFDDVRGAAFTMIVPLAEVVRAHERMEANQNLGKIVLLVKAGASAGG